MKGLCRKTDMLNSISSKLISHIFSRYINKIDPSQLQVQIWNGRAHLEDVSVSAQALTTHDLPFTVKRGSIGSIDLIFPWGKLGTEPCVISVRDVLVVAEVSAQVLVNKDLKAERSAPSQEAQVSEGGVLNGILGKIVDNLRFEIQNVHIRVELQHEGKGVAFGLLVESISVNSVDENGELCFVPEKCPLFRKKLQVRGLALYLDYDTALVTDENFKEEMSTKKEHSYLLKPFSFDAVLVHNKAPNVEIQNKVVVETGSFQLLLEAKQCRGIMALHRRYMMFNRLRMYSHCGRPDRYPRSDRSAGLWWRYVSLCAEQQHQRDGSFDVASALEVLRNRSRYYELCKQKKEKEVEEMEEQFESRTVTFLRANAEAMLQTEEGAPELSIEECQDRALFGRVCERAFFDRSAHLRVFITSSHRNKDANNTSCW